MSIRGALDKGRVRVLVELAGPSPGAEVLERLKKLGLAVDRIVGNKVTGSIAPNQLPNLERDASVRTVERSSKLKLS
jgi:hypothetical protein